MNSIVNKKILELFFEDANEMMDNSINKLLEIETKYDEEALHEIMRDMHSIKGGAGMMKFREIERFFHTLETVFSNLKSKIIVTTPEMVDIVLEAFNIVKQLLAHREKIFHEGEKNYNGEIEEEVQELEKLYAKINPFLGIEAEEGEEAGKTYRVDFFISDDSPMPYNKKTALDKELRKHGSIKKSYPEYKDTKNDQFSEYKILFTTNMEKDEIVEVVNIGDIHFVCVDSESNDLTEQYKDCTVYLNKFLTLHSVELMKKDLMKILKAGKIKGFSYKEQNYDIYGIQLIEAFKKEAM